MNNFKAVMNDREVLTQVIGDRDQAKWLYDAYHQRVSLNTPDEHQAYAVAYQLVQDYADALAEVPDCPDYADFEKWARRREIVITSLITAAAIMLIVAVFL